MKKLNVFFIDRFTIVDLIKINYDFYINVLLFSKYYLNL